ncbi:hypothetical protein IW262DRAFT_1281793, partial [Armillaria fumosa]
MSGTTIPQATTRTKPVNFMQLNCSRSSLIMRAALADLHDSVDVFLFQEPWWWKTPHGKWISASVNAREWQTILPAGDVGERPRVITFIRKRTDLAVTLRSDIATDPYIQVLDIQQGSTKLWLVHMYNNPMDRDELGKMALDRVQRLALELDIAVIITGDYNTHHPLW